MFIRPTHCAARFALVFALGLIARPATGQIETDTAEASAGGAVVYGTDTLFTLYGRLGPFGPAERAHAIERRLSQWSRPLAIGTDSIVVAEVDQRSELLVGDAVLMTVLDADAAPTGLPRAATAELWAARIREATATDAAARSPGAIALDLGKVLVATLVLGLLLFGMSRGFARLSAALRSARLPAVRIKEFELLSSPSLGESLTLLARAVRVALTVLLLYFYVPLVLSFFPWTAPYSGRIVGYLLRPLGTMWFGFLGYLPNVFVLLAIGVVTAYLLKFIRRFFRAIDTGALKLERFHRDWAIPTFTIVRFLVIAFAAIVMFPYLPGAGSDAFKGVSLFVGVLLSFGSSGAVSNVVAGVVLTYTNAFQLGDRVQIGETVGDVVQRTMLVTRVRTIKNIEVTIPNTAVLTSQVTNFSTEATIRGIILHTTVTIGYDAPWREVHALLIEAARGTEHILADPAPFVLQTSLDDFYVSYEINAYTDHAAVMASTYSLLHQNIQDCFNKAGMEIMSPHYGALRDGNQIAIPSASVAKSYRRPAFRVEEVRIEGHES